MLTTETEATNGSEYLIVGGKIKEICDFWTDTKM